MEFHHISVLLEETIAALAIRPDGIYVDGTAGGGGHSGRIAQQLTTGRLIALDKDPDAVAAATARLAPYGERAASLAGPLGEYLENLAYMGVLFEEKSLEDLQQAYSFHQALCLERSPQRDWDSLLAEIPFGVEEARKLNLSYGLKSFLEPGGDFCTFDREGAVLPPALGEGQETCSQQAALREASRCWNCSCFGAAAGSASAALLMLETVIQTSQRRLRAQDYFSQAEPWRQLKPEEALACLEVPMSGDFCSG